MPKGKATESKPQPKGPDANAGKGLDLSGLRRAAQNTASGAPGGKTTAIGAETARVQRPRVKWEELAGLDGLFLWDVWTDTGTSEETGESYDYVGAVVHLPSPVAFEGRQHSEVVVLTADKTRAGKVLKTKHDAGAFALMDGEGGSARSVRAVAKKSPIHPEGRPMVLLAIGEPSA
jgi:hypothetical protein